MNEEYPVVKTSIYVPSTCSWDDYDFADIFAGDVVRFLWTPEKDECVFHDNAGNTVFIALEDSYTEDETEPAKYRVDLFPIEFMGYGEVQSELKRTCTLCEDGEVTFYP